MNRKEAEDYIYQSYMKAAPYHKYSQEDKEKRLPSLSKDIIKSLSTVPCAVVTGSKGKGSVSYMISQILQSNIKIGLMTSPHITSFNERFRVNGEIIDDQSFVEAVQSVRGDFDQIEAQLPLEKYISPMGIQTAMALSYFNEKHTQVNVLECGKGVKYDDVNNATHEYAVINTIFLEHTRELGETLELIAEDKASIITGEQECIYVGVQEEAVLKIIEGTANSYNIPMKIYGRDYRVEELQYRDGEMIFDIIINKKRIDDVRIPLLGDHQARNCALAFQVSLDIMEKLMLTPNIQVIKQNLRNLSWQGRMQVLSKQPFVMVDACIHRESCEQVKQLMIQLNIERYTVIIGIPDDKDYLGVAKEMEKASDNIIMTVSSNSHYRFTDEQRIELEKNKIKARYTENVKVAIERAYNIGDSIVVLGTTSIVSDVMALFCHGMKNQNST